MGNTSITSNSNIIQQLPCQEPSLYCRKPSVMVTKPRTEQDSRRNARQKYPLQRPLSGSHVARSNISVKVRKALPPQAPELPPSGCSAFHLLPFLRGPYNLHGLNHNLSLAGTTNGYGDGGWDEAIVLSTLSKASV